MKALFTFNSEGAGHCSRSLAIAKELDMKGIEVYFAGAEKGLEFVQINDFPYFKVSNLSFFSLLLNSEYWDMISEFPPRFLKKTEEYRRIVSEFDLVISDTDYPSVVASILTDTNFVYLSHDTKDFYEKGGFVTNLWNRFSDRFSDDFILPNIFLEKEEIPNQINEVGPIAYEKNSEVEETDIFIVPSGFRNPNFKWVRKKLEDSDLRVDSIGDGSWKTKPNLYPYIKSASKVICSGYSTLMECSLANTPAIIVPQTPEQKFIAERLKDKEGFYPAESPERILSLVDEDLETPKEYKNGAKEAAQIIMRRLPE